MKRALLFLLLLATVAPVIGQDYNIIIRRRAAGAACLGDGALFTEGTGHAYLEVEDDPGTLEFQEEHDWSLIAWIRRPSISTEAVMLSQNESGTRQLIWFIDNGGSSTDQRITMDGSNVIAGSNGFVVDTWSVVAIAHDTDDVGVDVDAWVYELADCGTAVATDTGTHPGDDGDTPFADVVLGVRNPEGDLSLNFDGDIAYATYLNGTTITTAEVEAFCSDACDQIATWGTASKWSFSLDNDYVDDSGNAHADAVERVGGTGDVSFNSSGGPYD